MQPRQGQRPSDAGLSFDDVASGSYAPQSDRPPSAPPYYMNRSVSQTRLDPDRHTPKPGERVFYPTAFEQHPPDRQQAEKFAERWPQHFPPGTRPTTIYPPLHYEEDMRNKKHLTDYPRQLPVNPRYSPSNPFVANGPPGVQEPIRTYRATSPVGRQNTQPFGPPSTPVYRDQQQPYRAPSPNPNGFGPPQRNTRITPPGNSGQYWTLPTMTPALQPGIYDGHSDPTVWFQEYELICEANAWDSDAIRLRKLIAYLTEAPRKYLINERQNKPSLTYKTFKKGLISNFTSNCHKLMVMGKIQRCVQKPAETFEDYWYNKLQLMSALAPDLAEESKMNLLIEGLHEDLYVKVLNHVILTPPNMPDELFALIKSLNDVNLFIHEKVTRQPAYSPKKVQFNPISDLDQKDRYQREYRPKGQFPDQFQNSQPRYPRQPFQNQYPRQQFQNQYPRQQFQNQYPRQQFQNQYPRQQFQNQNQKFRYPPPQFQNQYPRQQFQNQPPEYSNYEPRPHSNYKNFNQWPRNNNQQWNKFFDWGEQRFSNPNQWNHNNNRPYQQRFNNQPENTNHEELKRMIENQNQTINQLVQKQEAPPPQPGKKWGPPIPIQTEPKKWNQTPNRQKPDSSQEARPQRQSKEKGPCFICQQMGHYANVCPNNTAGPSGANRSGNFNRRTQ